MEGGRSRFSRETTLARKRQRQEGTLGYTDDDRVGQLSGF